MNIEQFKQSCNKKHCLRKTMITPQCPKDYKQEQCYKKFIQKQEKDKVKQEVKNVKRQSDIDEYKRKKQAGEKIEFVDPDPEWAKVSQQVKERDHDQCRLWAILTPEEKEYCNTEQKQNMYFNKTKGAAHVIARSQSKNLFYSLSNLVWLGWCMHHRIDNMQDPLTGKPMTNEERDNWWIRIIGLENFNWLKENK